MGYFNNFGLSEHGSYVWDAITTTISEWYTALPDLDLLVSIPTTVQEFVIITISLS